MHFRKHYAVEGKHAFLGASKHHWINYDVEKMRQIFDNQFASILGTRKHVWAAEAIRLGLRQERKKKTLNMYINDAIGFGMEPEVVLLYNDDFFGTADALSFNNQILRCHDLKTGTHAGSIEQIMIYFALFCLEYNINPYDIEMIGRIYQNDEVLEFIGDPKKVREIMDKAKLFCGIIDEMREVIR